MKGRVKWWNNEESYGFIEYSENENVFVHLEKQENKSLIDGELIEFNLIEKQNGKFITNLKIVNN